MKAAQYRELELIFAEFNEAIVRFHDGLIKVVPSGLKPEFLSGMRETLQAANQQYRDVQDRIFRYEQLNADSEKVR